MLRLQFLTTRLAVCRLDPHAPVPSWATGAFVAIIRTNEELSVVCEEDAVPEGTRCEPGWRAFRVAGTLDFGLTGVLARLTAPLAEAGIPVFALSTFDTDYVLVRTHHVTEAVRALRVAGFTVET
ncbi:MAG: amino acid-binding protein [Rhodothermaceae bacterium]|nr:MAG: amino acid-binding protein [Rhodothermaceae bacterium]